MPEQGIDGMPWSEDREADLDEVQQLEPPHPRVPVDLGGPVRAQLVAPVELSIRAIVADDTSATKLANHDDRRASLTIIAYDQPVYIGMSAAEVQASNAAPIPKGLSVTLSTVRKVFVRCATPAATATVTVIASQFAR